MSDNLIFIHIPKTGGTTINSAMQGTYWQTTPDFNYRHIILKQKKSNSGDIFLSKNKDLFKHHKLFMMLRHPVDRMISEFYFLHDRAEFMNLLHPKPKTLEEYVEHSQTPNYSLGFLIGDKIYAKKRPTRVDLERVIKTIDELPIYTGIFEHFAESLEYFSHETGIEWAKNIEAKRVTFKRPKTDEIPKELFDKIMETNSLDVELYEYCLTKFNAVKKNFSKTKIKFDIDKYKHVIPYVSMTCLFEYFMGNKYFIKQNFDFFKGLTFFLLKEKEIKDGRVFTQVWNQTFIDSVKLHFPESDFYTALKKAYDNGGDELDITGNISDALDSFFEENPVKSKKFYKPMTFTPEIVILPEVKKKKGLFGRIFTK